MTFANDISERPLPLSDSTILVTGGSGFLGKEIVRRLLVEGARVRSLARRRDAELAAWGVEQFAGDIADSSVVQEAVAGSCAVVHAAAKAGVWGKRESYYKANVLGTENVLRACRASLVRRLLYTSSPSVVFSGRDQKGIDESEPYPRRYYAEYPATKAQAERLVLTANSQWMATAALRPHLIYGDGDPHLLPRLLARARARRLFHLGRQSPLVDVTYVGLAAEMHVNALARLWPGSPIAGRVFFVADGRPRPLDEIINEMLASQKVPAVRKRMPRAAAWAAASLLETFHRLFRPDTEPLLTRFVVQQMSRDHYFDLTAMNRCLRDTTS